MSPLWTTTCPLLCTLLGFSASLQRRRAQTFQEAVQQITSLGWRHLELAALPRLGRGPIVFLARVRDALLSICPAPARPIAASHRPGIFRAGPPCPHRTSKPPARRGLRQSTSRRHPPAASVMPHSCWGVTRAAAGTLAQSRPPPGLINFRCRPHLVEW